MSTGDPDVRIIQGDCLAILPTLEAGSIDAIVSDPPYGMKWNTDGTRFTGGYEGGARHNGEGIRQWSDIESDDQPFDPTPWLKFRKVILFGSNHYAARLPVGTTLVWLKKADHLFGTFLSDAEIAWMKGGYGVYVFRKQFPPPSRVKEGGIKGKAAHPTQKPIALMRWCIEKLKIAPRSTILDPYMGSGSTGVAAIQLGFNFIGIELDPSYCEIAQRRIDAARTPLFSGLTEESTP
jgi:site-specific DNA-methyltransferase (adenine-specific)